MEEYLNAFKNKKRNSSKEKNSFGKSVLVTKVLVSVIVFLGSMIFINYSEDNKMLYKKYVYTESLPFTTIKNKYEELFGSVVTTNNIETKTVLGSDLVYKSIEDYQDGEKLIVDEKAIVSNITSGIVVFIGEKENYGNTVIVQGIDGYDIWYGNIDNVSVGLYDYLEDDTVMGEVISNELYLVIKKGEEYIKYEEYQT